MSIVWPKSVHRKILNQFFWFTLAALITEWTKRADFRDTAFSVYLGGLVGMSLAFMRIVKPTLSYGILDTILFAILGVARSRNNEILGILVAVYLKGFAGVFSGHTAFSHRKWPVVERRDKVPIATLKCGYVSAGISFLAMFFLEPMDQEMGYSYATGLFILYGFILSLNMIFMNSEIVLEYCRRNEKGWVEDTLWFFHAVIITEWAEKLEYNDIALLISLGGLLGVYFAFVRIAEPVMDYGILDSLLLAILGIDLQFLV